MSAFDLRIYQAIPGQLATLERVLREVAYPLMAEHHMRAVGVWHDGATSTLYQITEHESAVAVAANWDALHADRRWQVGLRAIRQERSAVDRVETVILEGVEGLPPFPFARSPSRHGETT